MAHSLKENKQPAGNSKLIQSETLATSKKVTEQAVNTSKEYHGGKDSDSKERDVR